MCARYDVYTDDLRIPAPDGVTSLRITLILTFSYLSRRNIEL